MPERDYRTMPLGYDTLEPLRKDVQRYIGEAAGGRIDREKLKTVTAMAPSGATFSDLTIGITAFNRPVYFESCLGFIARYFPGANVIVADASTGQNKALHRESVSKLSAAESPVSISFQEFDAEEPQLNVVQYLVDETVTEFFLKWDDDDFYNPVAVAEAIETLRNKPDHVAMTGPSVNIGMAQGNEKYFGIYGHTTVALQEKETVKRLIFAVLAATPFWYCLFRTKTFQSSIRNLMFLRSTELDQLWDAALAVEVALHGLCGKTDALFMIRRAGLGRVTANQSFYGREMIYKLIDEERSKDYFVFRATFRKRLSRALPAEQADRITDEVCKAIFAIAFSSLPLYRSIYRDHLVAHPENNGWQDMVQSDRGAQEFLMTAVAEIDRTA